jgi:hypothetical protein
VQRIKGQEVEITIIADGAPQRNITAIRSFEVTWQLTKSSEGYLNETTNRKDSLFMGIAGNLEMHLDNTGVLDFIDKIIKRARTRTAGTKINIKATLQHPNGSRPRITISDVEFGDIPMTFGGRNEFGTVKLDFEAPEATVVN